MIHHSSESLSKNEQIALKKERFTKKNLFLGCFRHFLTVFTLLCQKSESLQLLFAKLLFFKDRWDQFSLVALYKKRDCERIAPVTLYKRATVSESISSIFKKERREWIILFHERIALLITKNEQFDLMIWSDDRIPNPDSHYNKNNPTANNKNVSTFRVLGIFLLFIFEI